MQFFSTNKRHAEDMEGSVPGRRHGVLLGYNPPCFDTPPILGEQVWDEKGNNVLNKWLIMNFAEQLNLGRLSFSKFCCR